MNSLRITNQTKCSASTVFKGLAAGGHSAYFIDKVVNNSTFFRPSRRLSGGQGGLAYNPFMMVKILLYGYRRGIDSSRKLDKVLYEDVDFRLLSANQQPNFWTIAASRRRHHKALGEIFTQTVALAQKVGLLKLKHVAGDGTQSQRLQA